MRHSKDCIGFWTIHDNIENKLFFKLSSGFCMFSFRFDEANDLPMEILREYYVVLFIRPIESAYPLEFKLMNYQVCFDGPFSAGITDMVPE